MTMAYSGVFLQASGSKMDYARLDWAFWNHNDPEAMAVMRRHYVTHLYVPALLALIMEVDLAANPELERVFASSPSDAFKTPNLIYRIRP